jgi:hypothetical protein
LTSVLPGWLAAVLPEVSKFPLAAVVSLALLAVLFFLDFGCSPATHRGVC